MRLHPFYIRRYANKLCSIQDTKNWTDFKVIDFQPKEASDYDIDVKIEFCGVCGSDVRFLYSLLTPFHVQYLMLFI